MSERTPLSIDDVDPSNWDTIPVIDADEQTTLTMKILEQVQAARSLLATEHIEEPDYFEIVSFDAKNAQKGRVAVWLAGVGIPDMENPSVYFLTQRDRRILNTVGIATIPPQQEKE